MQFTEKQIRMLRERDGFHFDSGRGNADNFDNAWALERAGLLTIKVNQYDQHATYDCTVTDKGRDALALHHNLGLRRVTG